METLNELGPDVFYEYACSKAVTVPKSQYHKPIQGHPEKGKTVSLRDLIFLLDKYTNRRRDPVCLDIKIIDSGSPQINDIKVWGVKDVQLRQRGRPTKFAHSLYGEWSCSLEAALRKGIPEFRIKDLRKNLHLRDEDGQSSSRFFAITQASAL